MHKLTEALKLFAAVCVALGALGVGYTAFVKAVSGRVIPWPTLEEVKAIVDDGGADVRAFVNNEICKDYTSRLARARMALASPTSDPMVAELLERSSLEKIKTIPGCS